MERNCGYAAYLKESCDSVEFQCDSVRCYGNRGTIERNQNVVRKMATVNIRMIAVA